MKRKMKITFEIEEMSFFKIRKSLKVFCEICGESVELLTSEKAASLLGLAEFQIFRLIESGNVHFIESGQVYVCRKSLEIFSRKFKEAR